MTKEQMNADQCQAAEVTTLFRLQESLIADFVERCVEAIPQYVQAIHNLTEERDAAEHTCDDNVNARMAVEKERDALTGKLDISAASEQSLMNALALVTKERDALKADKTVLDTHVRTLARERDNHKAEVERLKDDWTLSTTLQHQAAGWVAVWTEMVKHGVKASDGLGQTVAVEFISHLAEENKRLTAERDAAEAKYMATVAPAPTPADANPLPGIRL